MRRASRIPVWTWGVSDQFRPRLMEGKSHRICAMASASHSAAVALLVVANGAPAVSLAWNDRHGVCLPQHAAQPVAIVALVMLRVV